MIEAEEIKKLYLEYASQNIDMPKSYFDKINETEMLKDIVNNAIHSEETKEKLESIYQNYKDIISIDSMQTFIYGYALRCKTNSRNVLNKK